MCANNPLKPAFDVCRICVQTALHMVAHNRHSTVSPIPILTKSFLLVTLSAMSTNIKSPQEFLAYVNKVIDRRAWRLVDKFRLEKNKEVPDWPDYVFLPFTAWYAIAANMLGVERLTVDDAGYMQALAVAGTWRITQDIVRFDADVYKSILDTPIGDKIPCEIFYRLPAWCIFVETQDMMFEGLPVVGFWAMLEHDVNTQKDELRLFFLSPETQRLYPCMIVLSEKSIIDALIKGYDKDITERRVTPLIVESMKTDEHVAAVTRALNLLLYVCAYGFPSKGGTGGTGGLHRPQPTKIKTGWRLFPAQRVSVHNMGEDIGVKIREYRQSNNRPTETGTHASPRPHIRRAHWHGFWSGKIKATEGERLPERKFTLKWLPPIPVAMQDDDDDRDD